jgi:tRNA modification GTPase
VALVVTDARVRDETQDVLASRLEPALPRILVRNKIDLSGDAPRRTSEGGARTVWLSARTGAGIDLLQDAILDLAGAHEDMEGTFLARERHLQALAAAERRLAAAAVHLAAPRPPLELFAEELRCAQEALSAITGKFGADDLLGEIFSRFCIGK